MAHRSERLRNCDVRQIFRLLGELKELGRDPSRWRAHLLVEILPMIGARVGLAGEHFISPDNPADTRLVGIVEHGWLPHEMDIFHEYARTGAFANDPLHAYTQTRLHRSYTRRRREMVADETWYASPLVSDVRRRCNVDDVIHSRQNLPQPGWDHFLSLMRSWGEKPFGARERWMVNLLHRELGRLWRQVDREPLMKLPMRLRQTLDLILSGYSEKEIANMLCLSTHTVHDFARRLYRWFGVNSRSQLLGEPTCRRLLLLPALSPAYQEDKRGNSEGSFPTQS
jgi:hypothetical protein